MKVKLLFLILIIFQGPKNYGTGNPQISETKQQQISSRYINHAAFKIKKYRKRLAHANRLYSKSLALKQQNFLHHLNKIDPNAATAMQANLKTSERFQADLLKRNEKSSTVNTGKYIPYYDTLKTCISFYNTQSFLFIDDELCSELQNADQQVQELDKELAKIRNV